MIGNALIAPPGLVAQTAALVAAMSSPPDAARIGKIDAVYRKLILGGVLAKLDRLWCLAAHDSQASRLNWCAPGTDTLTDSGGIGFTADRGWTGDGSNDYLASTFNFSTGVNYTQDSACAGSWALTDVAAVQYDLGAVTNGGGTARICPRQGSNQLAWCLNSNSNPSALSGYTDSRAHVTITRTGANSLIAYRNAVAGSTISNASVARDNTTLALLRNGATYSTRQLALAYVGGALNATEVGVIDGAFRSFFTDIGAI